MIFTDIVMTMAECKTVLSHDWLTGFRGGERVLEALCELFPESPLYTLIYEQGSSSQIIENRKIVTSRLNKIPGIKDHYRKLLPLFPSVIDNLKISEDANLLISSSHCVSHCVIKGLKKPEGSVHISYIHSPMRYLYDQFDAYFGKHAPLYQQVGARAFRNYLTKWDIESNKNVDYMIANSDFVYKRIKQYYNRDSTVIHPFVDLKDFRALQSQNPNKDDFYLMVTAFAPNKRVDLAVEAFNQSGKRLKIIGSGQQEKWLKSIANKNIEFLGNLGREEVIQNMRSARGFIFPGVEDFGITPLESLASGTPVIAFKEGGVLETLTGETSFFFTEPTVDSLNKAVENFEKENFKQENLFSRAEEFSKESFQKKISNFVSEVLRCNS
jgi:glycosyltransferase involved in cell wall biosynthesis